MSNNNNNNRQDDYGVTNNEDDDGNDELSYLEETAAAGLAPEFIHPDDAVEVVDVEDDSGDVPMDDDDEEEDDDDDDEAAMAESNLPDLSRIQLRSHTGPVYCLTAAILPATRRSSSSAENDNDDDSMVIVTGGGDDRAFLHRVWMGPCQSTATTTTTSAATLDPLIRTQQLSHAHTDTVSAVAVNVSLVSSPPLAVPSSTTATTAPADQWIAVGGYDGAILVYDAVTGTCLQQFEGPTDVEWLTFHPTGTVLLVGSSTDGTVWMYHVKLHQCLQVFVGHSSTVTAGGFTPDGKLAVTASSDGSVRVWAPKTGQAKHTIQFATLSGDSSNAAAGLTCLAFGTPDTTTLKLVMVGTEDGQAHVCHVGTGKVVHSFRHYEMPLPTVQRNINDNNTMENEEEEDELLLPRSVEAVGFCPCQPAWCASAGVDGVLKIWDLTAGQCRQVCRATTITAAATGSSGDSSAAAAADVAPEGITRLTWHPTLPVVFTATTSGSVHLWDARNGALIHTLTTGSTSTINDMQVQFLPDNNNNAVSIVITASDDHTVRIFDVNVPSLLQQQQHQQQQS